MATSGTSVFNANRDQIITSALRKVAAIAEGELPSAYMLSNGAFVLEGIIKEAEIDGMPLWAVVETVIPCSSFVNGQVTIGLGQQINIPYPLKVLHAFDRDTSVSTNPIDIPMTPLTHYDYNWLSAKRSTGAPVQYYYEPMNLYGTLKLWPVPDAYSTTNRQIHITYQRPFEDAGTASNTLDFPPYWNNALIYKLAWMLAPEYGMPPNDRTTLAKESDLLWNRALGFGTEEGSLFVEPDWSRMTLGQRIR